MPRRDAEAETEEERREQEVREGRVGHNTSSCETAQLPPLLFPLIMLSSSVSLLSVSSSLARLSYGE